MSTEGCVADVQSFIVNQLPDLSRVTLLAGIVGDRPSTYAKSPKIWNAVFEELRLPARYVAFDVDKPALPDVIAALRACPIYVGGNVTVPYKIDVMPLLDEVDQLATHIGAVNTIVREPDGRLIGYNTDGLGGRAAITQAQPGAGALVPSLSDCRVVMLGAGGAGRALAFTLADGGADLAVANRDERNGAALAGEVAKAYGRGRFVGAGDLEGALADAGLVVNASAVGQFGLRKVADGFTCLEPYSPLAPASPPVIAACDVSDEASFYRAFMRRAHADVARNAANAVEAMLRLPPGVPVFDAVYAPLESTLLRHARLSGHPCLNGRPMNIAQAAEAAFHRVLRPYFEDRRQLTDVMYRRVFDIMARAW